MSGDIVHVDRLVRMADRFRCEPLRCVTSAASCISRQADARDGARFNHRIRDLVQHRITVPSCRDCPVGRLVAARVRAAAIAAAAEMSGACPRCGAATGAVRMVTHAETAGLCVRCRNRVAVMVAKGYSRADATVIVLTQHGSSQMRRGRELAVLGVATPANGLSTEDVQ